MRNLNDDIEEVEIKYYVAKTWPRDLEKAPSVKPVTPSVPVKTEKPKEKEEEKEDQNPPLLACGRENFIIDVKRAGIKPTGDLKNNLGYAEISLSSGIKAYKDYLLKKGKKRDDILDEAEKALERHRKSKQSIRQSITRILNTPIGGK